MSALGHIGSDRLDSQGPVSSAPPRALPAPPPVAALWLAAAAALAAGLAVAPRVFHHYDVVDCFLTWARASAGHRPWAIYLTHFERPSDDCDYPPVVLYLLTLVERARLALGAGATSGAAIVLLKLPAIAAWLAHVPLCAIGLRRGPCSRPITAPWATTRSAPSRPTTSGTSSTGWTSACAASPRATRARTRASSPAPSRIATWGSRSSPSGRAWSWPACGAGPATAASSSPPPCSSSPCSCCPRRCTSATCCRRPCSWAWSRPSRHGR